VQKTAESIEMPFGGRLMSIQGTMYYRWRSRSGESSPPRGVTKRRCGLLLTYFGHLFFLLLPIHSSETCVPKQVKEEKPRQDRLTLDSRPKFTWKRKEEVEEESITQFHP